MVDKVTKILETCFYVGAGVYLAYLEFDEWYFKDNPYPHVRYIRWEDRCMSKREIYEKYRHCNCESEKKCSCYILIGDDDEGWIYTDPKFWRIHDSHLWNFKKNNLQNWSYQEHSFQWIYIPS